MIRILFWRNFFRVVNPFRRFYWWIVKPETRGVKCLVEHEGKFLLVRIAYAHKQWTFPGGGVKSKEDFKDAALRELYEETGISIPDASFFGQYNFQMEHKRDTVQCFYAKVDSQEVKIDPLEIAEAGWFSRENMPIPRRGTVDCILDLYDSWKI